ncbi:hypothetical protein [Xylocopilactobacillus apicola]|uniref:Uncharacterized protein n=1 Tax=Xylocopilactobacillus apicola TaxID=2932184 RepID=A0AAU9CWZ3_9LACO|nr:hypothetical protein [Xylocopilactobacillus apicola]BDR58507.1 hypothetical protein XA3_09480 [Xylocopilactobacillus apicola]
MKFKKIIMIAGTAWAGYKIYDFFKREENLIWLQNLSDNSKIVNEKYQQFNKDLNKLQLKNEQLLKPTVKNLTKEINEFSYLMNFKVKKIQSNLQNLSNDFPKH